MLIEGLYSISSFQSNDNSINASIVLNKDHEVFQGHFPNNPVMPGVCMMQMIKELLEEAVSAKLQLKSSSNIKFMAIINPEKNPNLNVNIQWTEEEGMYKAKSAIVFDATTALKMSSVYRETSV